jgi:uncharacterized protein
MPGTHQRHAGLPDPMSNPNWHDRPTVFECEGDRLIGIIAQPEQHIETGVVIIVGGPQYRAGSHRQFTLLARQLAGQGIASIRFDYRGMGDSEGDMRSFEAIDADIKAAIDTFTTQAPNIKQIVLWGLCDAASASLYYGHTDPRVIGLILLNPWVHTEAGAARARLTHYYLSRLMQKSFWIKLITGGVKISTSVGDLAESARQAAAPAVSTENAPTDPRHGSHGYIDRMLASFKSFKGGIQVILSGNDLVASEFVQIQKQNKGWTKVCSNAGVQQTTVKQANHTFSSAAWRVEAEKLTLLCIRKWAD